MHADPNQYKPIAIVVPIEATLSKFVSAKGLASADTSLESLVQDKKVVDAVYAELLAVGKRAGLTNVETIQGVVLVADEWSPENVHLMRPWLTIESVDRRAKTKQKKYRCKI